MHHSSRDCTDLQAVAFSLHQRAPGTWVGSFPIPRTSGYKVRVCEHCGAEGNLTRVTINYRYPTNLTKKHPL